MNQETKMEDVKSKGGKRKGRRRRKVWMTETRKDRRKERARRDEGKKGK